MSKDSKHAHHKPGVASALRATLLGAGALVIVGLVLGAFGVTSYLDQLEFHHSEIEHLGHLRTDVITLERQLAQATDLLPEFERLQRRGVIGALAKNLEADRFEQFVVNHPANIRSFAMGAVEMIAPPGDLSFSTLAPGRHELTFTATPRHEVHLLRLLEQLPQALGGLSLLRACDITRGFGLQTGGEGAEASGSIRARCAIDWYVFSPSDLNAPAGTPQGQVDEMTLDMGAQ